MKKKKLISIVIPAYNEEACIEELFTRLLKVFSKEKNYNFEVLLIENGSDDLTYEIASKFAFSDRRFRIIKLSRNFRFDGGLTAGINLAEGDACVLMTADLQDPPELISDFLRLWEVGWENVYAIIKKRHGTGPIRTFNSRLFYYFAGKLTNGGIPRDVSDFRLVDKRVYKAVVTMNERNRFVRGLFSWVGFKSIGVPIERPERYGGESKAYTFGVIDLALKGIFAHSYKPLKLISSLGFLLSFLSFLLIPLLLIYWITIGVPFSGFGTLISLMLLIFSLTTLFLGLISEYISLIYEEVKARPNYIVSEEFRSKDKNA